MIEYGNDAFRHGSLATTISWCQDHIVVTNRSGQVTSIDPNTGVIRPEDQPEFVRGSQYEFSPNGIHLAISNGESVRVDSLQFQVDVEQPCSLAWSPDGARLAVGTDLGRSGRVWIFDLDSDQVVELKGARSAIEDIRWKPDGTRLVGRTMTTAHCWPSSGGKPVTLLKGKKFVKLGGWHGEHAIVVDGGVSVLAIEPTDASVAWTLPGGGPAIANDQVVLSSHLRGTDVIEHGTIVSSAELPMYNADLALDPAGGRVAISAPRVMILPIRDLESAATPPGWGHNAMIKAVDEYGTHFATVSRDDAVCVWKRGASESVSRIDTDRYAPTPAVAITADTLWVGTGTRVLRSDWAGGERTHSPEFSKAVTMVRYVGDALVVATEVHRSSMGQILVLDPDTLQVQFEADIRNQISRSLAVSDTCLRLFDGQTVVDLDLSDTPANIMLSEQTRTMSLGVHAGEDAFFPGFRLRHLPVPNAVEVLQVDEQVAVLEYPVVPSDGGLYLSNDAQVLIVPGADKLAFYAPSTGEHLGSYGVDHTVVFIHEFADGGLLVSALDGWLAELPPISEMIAAP